MKKIIAVILTLMMALSLAACGPVSPDEVTEGFMEAVSTQNKEQLYPYTENAYVNLLANSAGSEEQMQTIYDSIVKNLSWEIVSVEEDEEAGVASVTLKISNSDFSGVLGTYQTEAVKYATDNLAEESFTKEAMTEKCIGIYAQHVKAAASPDTVKTQKVTVELLYDEEYGWQLQVTDELMAAIFGGLGLPQ